MWDRQGRSFLLKCDYTAKEIQGQVGRRLARVDHQLLPIIPCTLKILDNPDRSQCKQKFKEVLKMQMCYSGIKTRLVCLTSGLLKFYNFDPSLHMKRNLSGGRFGGPVLLEALNRLIHETSETPVRLARHSYYTCLSYWKMYLNLCVVYKRYYFNGSTFPGHSGAERSAEVTTHHKLSAWPVHNHVLKIALY
jgi:hypothetical protein